MGEIWSRWQGSQWELDFRYIAELLGCNADTAMVNSLRRGNVPVRGKACDRHLFGHTLPLSEVVAGLLSVDLILGTAECELIQVTRGIRTGTVSTRSQKRYFNLIDPELAWEEFRADLIRYEMRAGDMPNTDPAEIPGDQDRGSTPSAARRRSASQQKQWLAYKRRVASFKKRDLDPPIQTTKAGEQGDREWATKNGVSRAVIAKWRRKMLKPSRGRPRNSAGK
jgi:hypothetical protein